MSLDADSLNCVLDATEMRILRKTADSARTLSALVLEKLG